MYSIGEYKNLISKYGSCASWAVWNYDDAGDTSIIGQNINKLHSKFILLGLNISRPLTNKPWSNFHDNSHARKLKYACKDTILHGSYITDIFKGIDEPKSTKFEKLLTDKIITENVDVFNQEMRDIKINDDTQFIVLGNLTARYFDKYFKQGYKNNVIYYNHYSWYGIKDGEWVNGLWKKLNINKNFSSDII